MHLKIGNLVCEYSIILSLLIISCISAGLRQVPEGQRLFQTYCSACHTIGAGEQIGPDLANIGKRRDITWIRRFIRSSQTLLDQGDSTARALFLKYNQVPMPDHSFLTDEQISAIIEYINSGADNGQPDSAEPPALVLKQSRSSESSHMAENINQPKKEDIDKGKALFRGHDPLNEGGPACISCHSAREEEGISGGELGPDLTDIYSRYDEKYIISSMVSPNYPSMQTAYTNNPVSREEARQIMAYLKYLGTRTDYQQKQNQRAANLLDRIKPADSQ